jgi:hypothetical protein
MAYRAWRSDAGPAAPGRGDARQAVTALARGAMTALREPGARLACAGDRPDWAAIDAALAAAGMAPAPRRRHLRAV